MQDPSRLDDATHLGWQQQPSSGDDDHLLIGSDHHNRGPDQPLLQFHNEPDDAPAAEDAPVEDAAIDAPPYLWGGEALAPEQPVVFGGAPAQESVFS